VTKPETHALTVDVEEYFHASNFAELLGGEPPTLPTRVEDQTRRLLDLFDELGCKGTFFTLGCVAERHPRLIAEIARRGHELASHGWDHALCHTLGPQAFRADVRRAREQIEDAAGVRVLGYRAPSYSITERSLWALPILAEEGFAYDSSIFPIHHPSYGIPDFPRGAARLDLGASGSIVELPLTCAKVGAWNFPVAGGAYLRFLPGAAFRWGFKRAAAAAGPAVLYLHPWEIDADQPRLRVGWKKHVRHYHSLGRVEPRLRRLLADLPFAPMARVLAAADAAGRIPTRSLGTGLDARKHASALQLSAAQGE
jgi:polysaccharide deacetylase family protein (PEP-CTERM system associated)